MSKLVSDKPKVAVIFENTAFGTSTSNGLREKAPGEGVEIVMFEPYSAGFADAGPLINKVKASGADTLFSVSYLNDLILIVRTIKQIGLKIAHQRRLRRIRHSRLLQERRRSSRRACRAWRTGTTIATPTAEKVNAEIQEAVRRVPLRICRWTRRANVHDRRRAGAGGVDRSAKSARCARDARRLVGLCGDGSRAAG